MNDTITGIKNIQIVATTQYPIVSAYEYEVLKGEEEIRQRISGCTIYFILQRPMMYFNNLTTGLGRMQCDIVDTVHEPFIAKLILSNVGLLRLKRMC